MVRLLKHLFLNLFILFLVLLRCGVGVSEVGLLRHGQRGDTVQSRGRRHVGDDRGGDGDGQVPSVARRRGKLCG